MNLIMKKSVLVSLFVGLFVSLTSCQKDDTSSLEQGSSSTSTLIVTIPQGIETKAAADYGHGDKINRCILEIYRDGELYGERQVAAVTGSQVTFSGLRLISSQTYDFVLWADCGEGTSDKYYNTTDLSAVTVNPDNKTYTGNDDGFDAFYAKETYTVEGSFSKEITLRRPFGQLNVKTNDLGSIAHDDLKPTQVKVSFTSIPTTFNVLTGEAGNPQSITYTVPIEDASTGDLTVDYILATPKQAELADFKMTFLKADGSEITTNESFRNIPIRRNYRTNVSGNLVTKQGTLDVTIDSKFEQPDIDDYPELRAVLANGGVCALTKDVEITAPLVVEGDKTVEIDLNGYDIINTTSLPDGQYGNTTVFEVKGGATLNIRGDGNIQAISTNPNEDGYRMAVYAYGDSKVNIYGGNFYNDQDYNDHNAQLDLIYADQNAVINIYGGKFESSSANNRGYWVLNLKDNSNAAINVYGGTFVNFDPSNSMTENPVKNFVVPTSTTVKISDTPTPNGTYEVVPEGGHVSVPIAVSDAASLTKALSTPAISQIVVTTDIDLSEATVEELTFAEHKTIEIEERATIQMGKKNRITAENGLTLIGKGTIDNTSADNSDLGLGNPKSLIHVMSGDCVIEGVTLINDPFYHWHGTATTIPYNSAAIAYWNDANVTVKNAKIVSGEFTLCGMGRSTASGTITLTDSYFESTSSYYDNETHYAYAMRLYGSKVRIDNCEVKGIQGGVSIEGCQDAVISSGKYYTVNSPGYTDAYYPLYITNGAIVTITGGEFSAANDRSGGLAIEGTSAVVSGDNDVALPTGNVILKGGKFSGKAYNHVTKVVYEPASGYQWQAITGSDNLRWEVVAE